MMLGVAQGFRWWGRWQRARMGSSGGGWGSNAEKRVQGWIEAACSEKHRESVRED